MSKDRVIGGGMLLAAIVVWIFYTLYGFLLILFPNLPVPKPNFNLINIPVTIVWLAVTAVLFIAAWIGWTLATTPPPKPIEEIEKELEEELKQIEAKEEASSET
ncbi:MAG: transcriptional regulator [Candidatus Baldrarchaeia archaeon]